MNLSKVYDYAPHYFSIAKLQAHLELLNDYWSFSKKNKCGKVFKSGLSKFCGRQPLKNLLSPLLNILSQMLVGHIAVQWVWYSQWVLEGSIRGSLLFNIFKNDILFFIKKSDTCNRNIRYSSSKNLYYINEIFLIKLHEKFFELAYNRYICLTLTSKFWPTTDKCCPEK